MHKDIESIWLDVGTIKKTVHKLALKIDKDYKHKNPILIGVLKGCLPFFMELFLQLTCDPTMDFMIVSSYSGAHSQHIKIVADLRQNIHNRHVLIVEDIVDTGRTLKKIMQMLKLRKPASLKVACLVDKPHAHVVNFKPDYTCFHMDKPRFVVGWGFDYDEKYRNLPYVGILKKSVYSKKRSPNEE